MTGYVVHFRLAQVVFGRALFGHRKPDALSVGVQLAASCMLLLAHTQVVGLTNILSLTSCLVDVMVYPRLVRERRIGALDLVRLPHPSGRHSTTTRAAGLPAVARRPFINLIEEVVFFVDVSGEREEKPAFDRRDSRFKECVNQYWDGGDRELGRAVAPTAIRANRMPEWW